jgi:hypothetical protein
MFSGGCQQPSLPFVKDPGEHALIPRLRASGYQRALGWASQAVVLHYAGPMIEQPPKPDVPHQPDAINHPPRVPPALPGDPEPDDRPDVHPVPPPTDPSPPMI